MTTLGYRRSLRRLSVTRLTPLTPPFSCEILRRATGALTPLLGCDKRPFAFLWGL